ncbi:MAG: sulfatase-like hydrolase/transferase [Candidatus Hydrogenedentes bacterium]|nr:sulfatase-like hydrolase/transferase [Candidatus Hydrogenedentota bacterium]
MIAPARNVLLIIADQFRWDCLGAGGNSIINTPNLDALAESGVLFKRCFVQTSPCGPSRMCIYTGRYMCSTRAVNNYTPLSDANENAALKIKEAGFRTAIFGYNDYSLDPGELPPDDPRKTSLSFSNFLPGFDHIYNHEYHSPQYFESLRAKGYPDHLCGPEITVTHDVPKEGLGAHLPLHFPALYAHEDSECRFLTDQACDYISGQTSAGWFASVNFIKPHPPRICPAPYHAMYEASRMPSANRRAEEHNPTHPYLQMARSCPQLESERDLRETRACYYGMISEVDANIGRIMETLKATGQGKNTLIVFTSDHGEYLGDHYFLDKGHFYDETMRVPLIIRDPSANADGSRGTQFGGLCESIDIAPTILEYLGVPVPDRVQGTSLLPALHSPDESFGKASVHFEYDFRGKYDGLLDEDPDACVLWVIRDDRYKYVQFGAQSLPPLLFDLQLDPGEHVNLAENEKYAGVVASFCQRMLRWRMKHEDQRMEHWASQYR